MFDYKKHYVFSLDKYIVDMVKRGRTDVIIIDHTDLLHDGDLDIEWKDYVAEVEKKAKKDVQ